MVEYPMHDNHVPLTSGGDGYYTSSRDESVPQWVHDTVRLGDELLNVLRMAGTSRELSLAKTKVDEAVMWALKHHTAKGGR